MNKDMFLKKKKKKEEEHLSSICNHRIYDMPSQVVKYWKLENVLKTQELV